MIIWVIKIFFVRLFCVFLPLLLNIFCFVRSILFLSFTVPIFAWNVSLVSLIFLKKSLVFPILLFPTIFSHCSLRKTLLSLLAIFWNSAFRWVYLSFFPLSLSYLLFSAICKVSSDNYFPFLSFFFLGMVLITTSCTMSRTSIHSSSGTLSIRPNPEGKEKCPSTVTEPDLPLSVWMSPAETQVSSGLLWDRGSGCSLPGRHSGCGMNPLGGGCH